MKTLLINMPDHLAERIHDYVKEGGIFYVRAGCCPGGDVGICPAKPG